MKVSGLGIPTTSTNQLPDPKQTYNLLNLAVKELMRFLFIYFRLGKRIMRKDLI